MSKPPAASDEGLCRTLAVTDPMTRSIAHVQRHTLRLLFLAQVCGSVGVSVGLSVGALLAADLISVGVSGLAQSAAVLGAALLAIPATRIVHRWGRRPSLAAAFLTAAAGALLVVVASVWHSAPLLFAGFLLFGGATTAGYQARFAAVDLAPPDRYGRHLSLVVWATTVGGTIGPNLASIPGTAWQGYGVSPLASPFVISAVLFLLCAALLFTFLRPDPFTVMRTAQPVPGARAAASPTMRVALGAMWAHPGARLGLAAVAVGHGVMVGVMSMTPVHIRGGQHAPADTLRLVGIVLSLHIAAMYAFAPVIGWLCDRTNRRRIVLGGSVLLAAACTVAGTAGHDMQRLSAGLFLLGLGWSTMMVAGSTLLAQNVSAEIRATAQGASDLVMGVSGATAGALAGLVVEWVGYPALAAAAASITVPLAALALASPSAPVLKSGSSAAS